MEKNLFSNLVINFSKNEIDNLHTSIRHDFRYEYLIKETSFLPEKALARQRMWHVLNNTKEIPKCKTCKTTILRWDKPNRKYFTFCSSKCVNLDSDIRKKIKETCLEKYGVDSPLKSKEIKNKVIFTNNQLYGTDWGLRSEMIKSKVADTNLEKYGVENVFESEEIQEKIVSTNIEKFGVKYPTQSDIVKHKIKDSNLSKFGVENIKQIHLTEYAIEKMNDINWLKNQHHILRKPIVQIANEIGITASPLVKRFNKFGIRILHFNHSLAERELFNFIFENIGFEILNNHHPLDSRKELDIYIPDLKLAFEYNGLYWHSQTQGKGKNYHLDKSKECYKQGIRLIHIFENEWTNQQDIVKSRILNLLGKSNRVYARKCKLVRVKDDTKYDFLEENHIQGNCISSINLGLLYNNQLVSIMTFGKSRFNKNYEYELLRFCNVLDTTVIGGASRILKKFIQLYNPKSIVSYADLRWSDGNLYNKLGFKFLHISQPNYWYFKGNDLKLYHRVQFQKHKLKDKLETFDSNLTEYENMLNNGYHRIFDCGNGVYGMEFK